MTETIRPIEAYASRICAGFHCNEVIERFGWVPPRVKGRPRVPFEVQNRRCCCCAADPEVRRKKAALLVTERVERFPEWRGVGKWRLDGATKRPHPCAI
jgi:hypothetical protein